MKSKVFLVVAALLSAAVAAFALELAAERPLIMAHRGGFVETEENTLEAYKFAIEHGVDIIECDPKRTKDGKWIIMHDETLDRTTVRSGRYDELTMAEYRDLRTKGGSPIPTLEEVLDLGKKHGVIVFLDLHIPPPDIDAFFKIVDEHGMTEMVIVNTWIKPFQRELKKVRPDILTCFPYPKPAITVKMAKKLKVDIVGTLPVFATSRMIRKSHKNGMAVVTMPINKKSKMLKFAEKNLDILQTDDPRMTEEVFGSFGRASLSNIKRLSMNPLSTLL